MWVGLNAVLVAVSPKFQLHVGEVPLMVTEVFENAIVELAQLPLNVKAEPGAGCIFINVTVVSVQPEAEVAISVIVCMPAAE